MSPHQRALGAGCAAALALALGGCGYEETTTRRPVVVSDKVNENAVTAPAPADNTAKNARDDGSTKTPMDQGTSASDMAITQAMRKAVVADKSLSTNAHNIKIVTKDGNLTLRGPVASEAERLAIVEKTKGLTGVNMVHNQLDITAR